MTRRERLDTAFSLQPVDRPPALGGWIAHPGKILALTGATEDEYWSTPEPIRIEAYRRLDLDGLLDINVPSERGGCALVTMADFEARSADDGPEAVVAQSDRLPAPDQVLARFNEQMAYDDKCAELQRLQSLCGEELYWCPARWEVIPDFEWYRVWGYESYLLAISLYPGHVARLYEHSAAVAETPAGVKRAVREAVRTCEGKA